MRHTRRGAASRVCGGVSGVRVRVALGGARRAWRLRRAERSPERGGRRERVSRGLTRTRAGGFIGMAPRSRAARVRVAPRAGAVSPARRQLDQQLPVAGIVELDGLLQGRDGVVAPIDGDKRSRQDLIGIEIERVQSNGFLKALDGKFVLVVIEKAHARAANTANEHAQLVQARAWAPCRHVPKPAERGGGRGPGPEQQPVADGRVRHCSSQVRPAGHACV